MKIAIITRHAISNYGSVLQTLATQETIRKMGYECKIIDYIRKDETYYSVEKTLLKNKTNWNRNLLKRSIYLLLRTPETIIAGKKFEKERSALLNTTIPFHDVNQLGSLNYEYDMFITGSDQVWGPTSCGEIDPAYFLSFVSSKEKCISYAASFGRTEFTEGALTSYKSLISNYKYLTVREDSALEILSSLGFESRQVLDPTLLLSEKDWAKWEKDIKYKNYVLVYQLHNDPNLDAYAKKVADKMGVQLIRISTALHQMSRNGQFIWCPSVGEFLSYIKNARCLITDSFHGTAFAINYNTNFVEVLPNNRTGTRNISILSMTGLTNRILKDFSDINLADQFIDFDNANTVIDQLREKSKIMLQSMVEGKCIGEVLL